MTTRLEIVAKYTTLALFGLGGLAAVAPVLARPDVADLLAVCAKTLALTSTCAASAVAAGYAIHRIKLWAAQRPPELRPQVLEALTHAAAPTLAGAQELATVAYESEVAEASEDLTDRWKSATMKFLLLGNVRGGFAWGDLKGLVDRDSPNKPGWDTLVHLLADHDPPVLELGSGSRKTQWAPGYSYSRARAELKWDRLELSYPALPPPVVRWARGWPTVSQNMQSKHGTHASTRAISNHNTS
jgi:hypothetical protein